MKEPPTVRFQDGKGRDLEAIIEGDDFQWKLWVDIQTKDAVITHQVKDSGVRHVYPLTIPAKFVDYEHLLQDFVDKQPK